MMTADRNVTSPESESRITFLDSLRYLFVFGVVIQHAGMAYIDSGWWPVDEGYSIIVGLLMTITDGFLMPSLFYISGYFVVPSIKNRGFTAFNLAKLKRLGVPWLVCTLFICPILPFVYHYTRNGLQFSSGYFSIWLEVMQNALKFDVGLMPPKPYLMQHNLFYQRYMWFISLLIFFFLIFSFIYRIKKDWFEPDYRLGLKTPSVWSTLKMFLSIGALTFSGSFILIGIMFLLAPDVSDPETWFTLGNIIQFRVSRIFLHITYFILGIFTYKYRWLQRNKFPGHQKTCVVFFLVILVFYLSSRSMLEIGPVELKPLFSIIFWLFLNFFAISALGLSLCLSIKYLNQPTPLNQILSANSFNFYLTHYIIVIGFQFVFLIIPGLPLLLKYGLVCTMSLFGTYIVCQFLIRPYPRFTVVALAGLFSVMTFTF
ncbi:MAG: acyltransferase family protein [Desulfobacteraceae bacterium]